MKKWAIYMMFFLLGAYHCVPSPTKDYIDNFENTYGSLNEVENLVLEAKFDKTIDTTVWTAGSHHYDFRSGNGKSQSPQFFDTTKSIGLIATGNSTSYASSKYEAMASILLKNPLKTFTIKNGQSISVKFDASLAIGTGAAYNKIIIVLSTANTKENFKIESSTVELCNEEVTGEGLALVFENDKANNDTRYLRAEKLQGVVKGFGAYSGSCVVNAKLSTKAYGTLTNDLTNPYANSGFYPSNSWRFYTLNPSPKLSNETATKFQYEYTEDPAVKSSETMFLQQAISKTDLNDTALQDFISHEITIKPDSTIEWKFNGNTYQLSSNSFDLNYEFNYVSIKIQEVGTTPIKGKTRIKNLVITQK